MQDQTIRFNMDPIFDIVCAKIKPKPDGETTDLYDKIRPKSRIVLKKLSIFTLTFDRNLVMDEETYDFNAKIWPKPHNG